MQNLETIFCLVIIFLLINDIRSTFRTLPNIEDGSFYENGSLDLSCYLFDRILNTPLEYRNIQAYSSSTLILSPDARTFCRNISTINVHWHKTQLINKRIYIGQLINHHFLMLDHWMMMLYFSAKKPYLI